MIAVVTGISRFYFEIAGELKKRDQDFLSLKLGQTIPRYVDVVITTDEEKEKIDFEKIVSGDNIRLVVDQAIQTVKGAKSVFKHLVIGIDPGVKPGLVVMGDKTIIYIQHLISPEEASEVIENVLKRYKAEEILIKVGSGGDTYRSRILKNLQQNFDIPIEVVNEISTTPTVGKVNGKPQVKDIVAAINIALKEGKLLKKEVKVEPKKGEIKNIQKQSRKISNDITISQKLAEQVLKGKITIEEAIQKQKKKTAK